MIHIISSLIWVSGTVLVHIVLSKVRLILGWSRLAVLGVFIVGLVGCVLTTVWYLPRASSSLPLPLTGIFLYIFCSLAYLAITGSPTLGDESPTTKILLGLRRKGPLTQKQIFSLFTYREVIGKRMNDLLESQWIQKKGNALVATRRGRLIASFFTSYRRILGLSEGG